MLGYRGGIRGVRWDQASVSAGATVSRAGCPAAGSAESPVAAFSVSPGPSGLSAGASLRASFLACLSSRRSRSLLSRVSFAIVVFSLPLEAMSVRPLLWSSERVLAGSSGVMHPRPWSSLNPSWPAWPPVPLRHAALRDAEGAARQRLRNALVERPLDRVGPF